jgi:hypothetical protein
VTDPVLSGYSYYHNGWLEESLQKSGFGFHDQPVFFTGFFES